jgi:hypothetical protein
VCIGNTAGGGAEIHAHAWSNTASSNTGEQPAGDAIDPALERINNIWNWLSAGLIHRKAGWAQPLRLLHAGHLTRHHQKASTWWARAALWIAVVERSANNPCVWRDGCS